MAAYAALVSLMNDLELIPNHPTHSFSFDKTQISTLSKTVNFLVDFMETYDSHGCTRQAAEVLEGQIAFAAHAAHDVIESHAVDQIHAGSTRSGKARSYFLLDLQKSIHSMEFVKRKAMRFISKSGLKEEQLRSSSKPPTYGKNRTAGSDGDAVLRLTEMLTGGSSDKRVIPIVGMGGIGKTTLARNVFDHSHIHDRFDLRLWATVSQEYSIETILMELLYGERKSFTSGNACELGEKLHKKLWGRRYLIVLDDMWSERAWDGVHIFLPDNGNGSRVVVTTRLSYLSPHLSSSSPFEMNFLDEDKSWELFCGKAFGEEEDCPVEFEEIGKKIVKRCGGLPLSLVVIGGHLRRSSGAIEYWEKLSNSINPISSLGVEEQCLEILSLSYEHLPACLKPCFLYMGVYPEDRWIYVSELIKYWVGEGFIKPKKGLILEETAEDYLEDLIDRNLILVRSRRWNGKAEFCAIHDLVRELCLTVAKKDKLFGVVGDTTQGIGCKERRIVIPAELSSVEHHHPSCLEFPPLLRSLICQGNWLFDELLVDLRLLRLSANLDIHMDYFCEKKICFPTSKFEQVNLRYIASYVFSTELPYFIPSSISMFWNVQTLTLRSDFGDEIIVPYEIWEMPQLRHLQFDRLRLPYPLPNDESNQEECIILRNLHTLLGVIDFKLTEYVCKRIPNIKELSLSYETLPGDWEEASSYYCLHNLVRLNKLKSLQCYFSRYSKWRDVFQSITFPSSLVELTIKHCHWEDLTKMLESIPNLGYLKLQSVWGPEWNLAEEEFPHLKVLEIYFPHDLIHWNASSSNFPALEKLRIFCWDANRKLSEIPFDLGEIPTLRHIELTRCSASCASSAMRILVEQENLGNDQDLQLTVRFDKMEEVERFQKMVKEEGLISDSLILYDNFHRIKAT